MTPSGKTEGKGGGRKAPFFLRKMLGWKKTLMRALLDQACLDEREQLLVKWQEDCAMDFLKLDHAEKLGILAEINRPISCDKAMSVPLIFVSEDNLKFGLDYKDMAFVHYIEHRASRDEAVRMVKQRLGDAFLDEVA